MKNIIPGYLFIFLWITVSCQTKKENHHTSAIREIESYFQSEINTLEQSTLSLTKKLHHDGTVETIHIDHPDWAKELIPFTETIANQPAQIQAFKKDSVLNGTGKVVQYSTLDSTATIKSMTAYYTSDSPDSVIIIKQVRNSYYASSDTLKYFGNGNYHIRAENLPGFGKKLGFVIEGTSGPAK